MRIALLEPGAAESGSRSGLIAAPLAAAGHRVTVMSAAAPVAAPSGVEVARLWRPPRLPAYRFYEDDIELVPATIWRLLRGSFDLAHALAPAAGWAAAQAKRLGGPPFLFTFGGPLTRRWLVDRHYRLEMMVATAAAAAGCTVDDGDTAIAFRRYLLRDAEVVPLEELPRRLMGLQA